jgi:hypothetical protein
MRCGCAPLPAVVELPLPKMEEGILPFIFSPFYWAQWSIILGRSRIIVVGRMTAQVSQAHPGPSEPYPLATAEGKRQVHYSTHSIINHSAARHGLRRRLCRLLLLLRHRARLLILHSLPNKDASPSAAPRQATACRSLGTLQLPPTWTSSLLLEFGLLPNTRCELYPQVLRCLPKCDSGKPPPPPPPTPPVGGGAGLSVRKAAEAAGRGRGGFRAVAPLDASSCGLAFAAVAGLLVLQGTQQAVAATQFGGLQPADVLGDLGDISTGFASVKRTASAL